MSQGRFLVIGHMRFQPACLLCALGIQPWGDYYGKLTDRFGVQWMLNCILR